MRIEPLPLVLAIVALTGGSQMIVALASDSAFTGDNFHSYASDRPPINPDFDPDYSCLFDVYQVQCVRGSQQECPEGFGDNEDDTCFPVNDKGYHECPDGYHGTDDDETGQCYSNEQGCEYDDYILITTSDSGDKLDRCAHLGELCDKDQYREREECVEYCRENPQSFGCKLE